MRVWGRRAVVSVVVVAQLFLVGRAYWADHREFGFQMFPESSQWRADIVRVTGGGERIPVDEPWAGYRWGELVKGRGLGNPSVRHHADAGLDNQVAFLQAALDWVAANTDRDDETVYLEATVVTWHNDDEPEVVVLRSHRRDEAR